MSVEKRYIAAKAQGLIKEYSEFLKLIIDDCLRELDTDITETTPEMIGLEYAKRLAGKRALKLFMTKLHSKADERE